MGSPNTVGGNSESFRVATQNEPKNQTVRSPQVKAFGRTVSLVEISPQKGLKVRIKKFLPVSIYKFLVKLSRSDEAEQKTLAQAIKQARKENDEAWNELGSKSAGSSDQQVRRLQLQCEISQYTLDLLEGRGESPVTAIRSKIIQLLENASGAETETEFEAINKEYLETNQQLKKARNHESTLEIELDAAVRKLESMRSEVTAEADTEKQEELKQQESLASQLHAEFCQFQKMQVDQDAARKAFRRFGDQITHRIRGRKL